MAVILTFPDGSKKEFEKGVTGREIAKSISHKLAKEALCIKIDDDITSLDAPIKKDAKIKILTFEDEEGKYAFRHSSAHVLAHAIKRLYSNAKNTIGPPVDEGFYYDFDDLNITPEDFPKIESEMQKIIEADLYFEKKLVSLEDIKKLFPGNSYKKELAEDFLQKGEKLTTYRQGDFEDLCEGPHVTSTSMMKAIKLMKLAGAFWRGDSKNKQLTRVYGTSFPSKKQLDEYLNFLEEAKKRDHRRIGQELELFMFHDWSPGSVFFYPKGAVIINELVNFLREEYFKRGYSEVFTPQIFNKALWEKSGHWQHYKENIFLTEADGQEFALKPMNCPSHLLMYTSKVRSYRELPLRYADFGSLHRNEIRGTLSGLFRVRKLCQDDAHIFCTSDQIQLEILSLIDFIKFVYKDTFDFDYNVELSTKPEKALGDELLWAKAEQVLIDALNQSKINYKLNPGDGAFYGPKIDFHVKDCLGRTWQCATIQLDFQLPERFNAEYVDADGKKHKIVMIHRAILGSLERFAGILVEHFAGKLPLWLTPVQVQILTIADRFIPYAQDVAKELKESGIRVEIKDSAETMNKKVREAQLQKIPLILTVGEKEEVGNTLAVRTLDGKVYFGIKRADFVEQIKLLIKMKGLKVELK
ncbi:threonine--tRNA ligase [Candidatus Woesearchaeota archaeon]|nr:threonine--tRNA ligase [Candidatus Woesearchaeota archaeon]